MPNLYLSMDTCFQVCQDRSGESSPEWNGQLFGKMTIPFVDMTVKGWVWYQGENNMGETKGMDVWSANLWEMGITKRDIVY